VTYLRWLDYGQVWLDFIEKETCERLLHKVAGGVEPEARGRGLHDRRGCSRKRSVALTAYWTQEVIRPLLSNVRAGGIKISILSLCPIVSFLFVSKPFFLLDARRVEIKQEKRIDLASFD
jgi:hypothetical protein